jgi:RNA polymerase sigma-54 factor
MKLELNLTQKQTIGISPKMQQAIKLLQLSAAELEAEIMAALENNPLLETAEDTSENIDVDPTWDELQPISISSNANHSDPYHSPTPTLHDYLDWQLNLTPFSDRDKVIALNIIDSIDDDGYLTTSIEDLHCSLQRNHPDLFKELDIAEIMVVLHRIQQFDPIGIAARDLAECLLLQLTVHTDTPELIAKCSELVTKHLELLASKDYTQLKTLLNLDEAELQQLLDILLHLNPKPGALVIDTNPEYIIPDVIVKKVNMRWHVALNKDLRINLRLNNNYANLAGDFFRAHYQEAQWLINSIKTRNQTLLKVASYIIKYQKDFLDHGELKMRPLNLHTIADDLNLHASTVSRITSRKYIHTPRGLYELKFFLSGHLANIAGPDCSSTAVKAIIKEIVEQEDPCHCLSDQHILDLIAARGIKLARRTVTKYREALGIKPSSQRGA